MSKKGKVIHECHYGCYIVISTSSPSAVIKKRLKINGHMQMNSNGLEYRQALCCWILIFTAAPDNVAEKNMAIHNASVTQNGLISATIRPSAQKHVLLFFNHLLP